MTEKTGLAVLSRGFRPFFPVALLVGGYLIAQWAMVLTGAVSAPTWMIASRWHAHEMVFGYTLAVVAGFLLTAVPHWTKKETPTGGPLAALVGVWLVARFAMQGTALPELRSAIALLFPIALTAVIGRVIVSAGNRRNYMIVAILGALAVSNAVTLFVPSASAAALFGAVHLIAALMVVIGGRIVPMFTRNKLGVQARNVATLERLAIVSTLLAGVALTVQAVRPAWFTVELVGVVALACGVFSLARMATWKSLAAMREPMLAVLHVGSAWVGVGYLLIGYALLTGGSTLGPMHALTVGGIGTLTLGMIVRVSLGHTGRPIVTHRGALLGFVLVAVGALGRVFGELVLSVHDAWMLSAICVASAFWITMAQIIPWAVQPRVDA